MLPALGPARPPVLIESTNIMHICVHVYTCMLVRRDGTVMCCCCCGGGVGGGA